MRLIYRGLPMRGEPFSKQACSPSKMLSQRSDWAAADTQLVGLAQAPGGVAAAGPLAADLAAGRLQESFLATAGLASELRVQSSAPAVYPPEALERGIEGWVELEYIVDRTADRGISSSCRLRRRAGSMRPLSRPCRSTAICRSRSTAVFTSAGYGSACASRCGTFS